MTDYRESVMHNSLEIEYGQIATEHQHSAKIKTGCQGYALGIHQSIFLEPAVTRWPYSFRARTCAG
jgi:hypothetical protein